MGKDGWARYGQQLANSAVSFGIVKLLTLGVFNAVPLGWMIRHTLATRIEYPRAGTATPAGQPEWLLDNQPPVYKQYRTAISNAVIAMLGAGHQQSTPVASGLVVLMLIACASTLSMAQFAGGRDPRGLDILTRTITANGGLATISVIQDLSETGQITFPSEDNTPAPVLIQLSGSDRFRMEVDVSAGKTIWIANGDAGSKQDSDGKHPMLVNNAANLGAFTFPLAYVPSALQNTAIQVSLVGVEQKFGRSVYRIRIQGQVANGTRTEKDLVIDALTFDILSMNDQPLPAYVGTGKSSADGLREVDFGDFRSVQGIRVPFSIISSIHGQQMINITLNQVKLNTNVAPQAFQP